MSVAMKQGEEVWPVNMSRTIRETILVLKKALDRWPTEDEVFNYIDGDSDERKMILEERLYGEG